jgi:uncharacterized protein (DUF1697 family)
MVAGGDESVPTAAAPLGLEVNENPRCGRLRAMPRQVAFIRAVMLGRQGLSRELVLQAFVESGAGDPRSCLATGNVSFDADALSDLTSLVERAITKTLGRHEPIFVRSVLRLAELAARDPFERYRTEPTTFMNAA